ncbi:response regulator transcription factor [Virgibacillus dokdonensis]|uniref:Response regulator transcription factor n=1 Tax=Virgibacillus dokdonensis TaxID=302167 RepID=A0A2K9IV01_9BACI|nr:response regulator transcription factor [Virgibacillus dokdonensis]AUJ23295.1 Transcriptional regulatory protein DegU [Virgibacillus dokdonensis]
MRLDQYMDTFFQYGLCLLRENQKQIEYHWKQVSGYFESGETKLAKIPISLQVLSDLIFDSQYDKEALLIKINEVGKRKSVSQPMNQFVITLMEIAVHRVVKRKSNYDYSDLQAIQYVFMKMRDHILTDKQDFLFTIDDFLDQLVNSEQFPIDWLAVVEKNEQVFYISKWFQNNTQWNRPSHDFKASTFFNLTEELLKSMPYSNNKNTITIPYKYSTLLICIDRKGAGYTIPFINYILQLFENSSRRLKAPRQEQQWKDSVIMFYESIIEAKTFDESVKLVTQGFINYLPFERCGIFSYSSDDRVGSGLLGHQFDNKAIQEIMEDVRNLPLIDKGMKLLQLFGEGMKYLQPLFITDAKESFPIEYINKFQLKSIVVAPLYQPSNNRLIGAAILDQGPYSQFSISQDAYTALLKFGQSAGEVIGKFEKKPHIDKRSFCLTVREVEVLALMAEGESTSSAADKLHLSEYTVRDYMTAIMRKMEVKNRTEAVAYAIRKGII